jgi:hypothetical protein
MSLRLIWRLGCAILVSLTFAPISSLAGEEDDGGVTPGDLFGDLELPYDGDGAVAIAADGLMFIDWEDENGTAFFGEVLELLLVEEGGTVTFRTTNTNGTVLHEFEAISRNAAAMESAVYSIEGTLSLEYDEKTSLLYICAADDTETFQVVFDLSGAEPYQGGEGEDGGDGGEDWECPCTPNCSCFCMSPTGCTHCKSCPTGYHCSCNCAEPCDKRCTPCRRAVSLICPIKVGPYEW